MQSGSILRELSRASFRPIPRASLLSTKHTSADRSASDFKKHLSYSAMADAEPQQPPAAASPAQEAPAAEEQSPQFSPSEFRIYNRMAEHMDYYVIPPPSSPSKAPSTDALPSTTYSARPGTRSTRPARPHGAPRTSRCANSSAQG